MFLRTAEKKREASRSKESNDTTPITPVDAPKPSLPEVSAPVPELAEKTADASGDVPAEEAAPQSAAEPASGHEEDKQVWIGLTISDSVTNYTNLLRHQQQEVALNGTEEPITEPTDVIEAQEAKDPIVEGDDTANNEEQDAAEGVDENAEQAGDGEGQFNDAANGGFQQNMMFPGGGDFNQMQMMMAMQNGMGQNSFGGFPMMGKAPFLLVNF